MALQDIEHIVVLVMENRSFDHMLGYLTLTGRTDVDGLRDGLTNPNHSVTLAVDVKPMLLGKPRFSPGPHHQYHRVAVQLGPVEGETATMKGFVDDYASVLGVREPDMVMGYHDAAALPVYDFFAREYLLCDRWFSSVPGPTHVNRAFLLAGHSDGFTENGPFLEHIVTHRLETVLDRLSANDVTWRSYFHDVPALRLFRQFRFSMGHIRRIERFFEDANNGSLPSVSWIDPNFDLQGTLPVPGIPDGANDDHPPADVTRGQRLAGEIYKALIQNQSQWEKTLFILTYDEHGGFFDHVEPPLRPGRAPFGNPLFARFGVRVPTFLISPWVERAKVAREEFEHTSIAKTILDRFCPGDPIVATMGERLAGAPSLAGLLAASVRSDRPPPPEPVLSNEPACVIGGISREPVPLGAIPPSDLQTQLLAMRVDLLHEGMPPDTV